MPDAAVLLGDAYDAVSKARAQLDRVRGLQDLSVGLDALIKAKSALLDAKLATHSVHARWVGDQVEILNTDGQWVRGPHLHGSSGGFGFRWRGSHLDIRGPDGLFREGPNLQGVVAVGSKAVTTATFVPTEIFYTSVLTNVVLVARFVDTETEAFYSCVVGMAITGTPFVNNAETFYASALLGTWLLSGGVWSDSGVWNDSAHWED